MSQTTTMSGAVAALDANETVREMFAAAESGDVQRFASCWAEDAEWQNMPLGPPVRGRAAILKWWQPLLRKPGSLRVEFVHIANDGSTVLTERIDTLQLGPFKVSGPVSGVFEVRAGQITKNREYWDLVSMLRATLKGRRA